MKVKFFSLPTAKLRMMAKRASYLRDGRAPIPLKEATSRVMSANKGKNTHPELMLRKTIWNAGIKGYRLHEKGIPGRPDLVFTRHKLALFVHGCFWHRCPYCDLPMPKSNTAFWVNKFSKNIERDRQKEQALLQQGWKVITIWECEIKRDADAIVRKLRKLLTP
jgi:DNA mismatch endonuclease, patch repair protein